MNFKQYAKGVKPGINRNEIYSIKLPFPTLPIQQKIVSELNILSDKIKELKQLQAGQLADMRRLENAYLREAFT